MNGENDDRYATLFFAPINDILDFRVGVRIGGADEREKNILLPALFVKDRDAKSWHTHTTKNNYFICRNVVRKTTTTCSSTSCWTSIHTSVVDCLFSN